MKKCIRLGFCVIFLLMNNLKKTILKCKPEKVNKAFYVR